MPVPRIILENVRNLSQISSIHFTLRFIRKIVMGYKPMGVSNTLDSCGISTEKYWVLYAATCTHRKTPKANLLGGEASKKILREKRMGKMRKHRGLLWQSGQYDVSRQGLH